MRFDSNFLGTQAFGPDDRTDAGVNYGKVRDALFKNAYYLTWGSDGDPPLPVYSVSLGRVLRGFLPGGKAWQMKAAAARALKSKSTLRWGADKRGFRRLLHPNGVCLFGRWTIDKESDYTGYFRPGSEALIIARYSTCCTECRRGYYRSLSLVGTLFPTNDPAHVGQLPTASFITQEDLGGAKTEFINDAKLRNAPNVSPWRRGWGVPILLLTGLAFQLVDREPTQRQLYEIAELGKPDEQPTRSPRFMELTVEDEQPRIEGVHLDFRDEILHQIYDRGDPVPRRKLTFCIRVSDQGRTYGKIVRRRFFKNWQTIGRIEFMEAVASYNGDHVLHMHHPKWRTGEVT